MFARRVLFGSRGRVLRSVAALGGLGSLTFWHYRQQRQVHCSSWLHPDDPEKHAGAAVAARGLDYNADAIPGSRGIIDSLKSVVHRGMSDQDVNHLPVEQAILTKAGEGGEP